MGTSKGYGGPPTDLVPSWLAPAAGDAGTDGYGDGDGGDSSDNGPADGGSSAFPVTSGFTAARTAFTRFSKNGSASSLGSALANYVRGSSSSGSRGGGGGVRRAAQRMGASRGAGSRLLGVVRDFQQVGAAETLRRLDLGDMVNRPAADVFVAMLEFLCPPGGAIDEAISRQAMLEAIGNLEDVGTAGFGEMAPEQLREFFMDFVALSIEGRVIADIAARGVAISSDIESVENTHTQLHEFIDGCCRVHLSGLLTGLEALGNRELDQRVDEIYEAAFSLIAEAGEDAQ
jgi:hypothetical protein